MEVLRKQDLLEEVYRNNRKVFLKFIWLIPAVMLGLLIFAILIGAPESLIWMDPQAFTISGCGTLLFELLNLIGFIRIRNILKEADVEIIEDVIIDEEWHQSGGKGPRSYYLLCLSGTVYPIPSPDAKYAMALQEVYVVYIIKNRNRNIGGLYIKSEVCLEEELQKKVIRKCVFSTDDTEAVWKQLKYLYDGERFLYDDGKKFDRAGYYTECPKCPNCGKRFKPRSGFSRYCTKCGTGYDLTVSDLMVQKGWWMRTPYWNMKLNAAAPKNSKDTE